MKYINYVILFLIVIPISVNASFCPTSSKAQYKNQSENIVFTYDYIESDSVTFNITISNIPEGFIIKDNYNDKLYSYTKSEITLTGYLPGETYSFDIYVSDIFCDEDVMNKKYVITPAFNPLYKDLACEGIEDYELCLKWIEMPYSYEEFINKITKYKLNIDQIKEEEIIVEYESIFLKIIKFYTSYYYFILPPIIILSLIKMYREKRKHDLF